MGYGFYKVAAAPMNIVLGDTLANAQAIIKQVEIASKEKVELIVFPELSITGYTCGDIFSREEIFRQAKEALAVILEATAQKDILICVGMPIMDHARAFNCAVYLQSGHIVGVIPKTYIPNYSEFYEKRWFVSGSCRLSDTISLLGELVPFSENLLLRGNDGLIIGTEICEDLWVDSPPSGLLSRAGATIIVNPSASNDIIGKRAYRRDLVSMQSAKCRCGYVYASCGNGESTTDLVWSGHCIVADDGRIVSESEADSLTTTPSDELVIGLIDIDRLVHDKRQSNSATWEYSHDCMETPILGPIYEDTLPEYVDPYPFVPHDEGSLNERCNEILVLQAKGLMQRLKAINCKDVVIGISGGLDSTLALLVCCIAFDKLGLNRNGIHAITMPGFGTSVRTHTIADKLMEQLNVTYKTIDIKEASDKHLSDLGHAKDLFDITYENTQARERTQILFDYANMVGGIVIGTGDMSELALGWCTYNGDHMSNYAVNVGVPKTLVKYLVRTYALNADAALKNTLMEVFDLPISPELLPTTEDGDIAQKTEESIGKYDIHDFYLYHFLRNGENKEKMFALAKIAYPQITDDELKATLETFYSRFRTQQFKRSCLPDGVKIGTVAISPRGDLRLPSDLSKLC